SELLVPLLHPSHLSRAYPDYFRGLQPRYPSRYRSQYDLLYFHCPLHCGFRVVLQVSPPEVLTLRLVKRTFHLLFRADISCATDTSGFSGLQSANPHGRVTGSRSRFFAIFRGEAVFLLPKFKACIEWLSAQRSRASIFEGRITIWTT